MQINSKIGLHLINIKLSKCEPRALISLATKQLQELGLETPLLTELVQSYVQTSNTGNVF